MRPACKEFEAWSRWPESGTVEYFPTFCFEAGERDLLWPFGDRIVNSLLSLGGRVHAESCREERMGMHFELAPITRDEGDIAGLPGRAIRGRQVICPQGVWGFPLKRR